jgi:hypothetical protein
MKRSSFFSSVAACLCLGLSSPLLAADPDTTTGTVNRPPTSEKNVSTPRPAEKCLGDLLAFDKQIQKDGYWVGGSAYGYGYPIDGLWMDGLSSGYRPPMMDGRPETTSPGYQNARPGYEVRILLASANILAQRGQQLPCETVLATTREVYKVYAANMHNPQDEIIGSVEDLVTSPQTGKTAYLVIGRGGLFGIDEKYVPIPWADLKISPSANLLVLDTTKASVEGAPLVSKEQFATPGQFDQQSQKVDAYWKTHLSDKGHD